MQSILKGDKCKVYCCLSLFIRIPRICSASPRSFIENAKFSCCFRAFRVLFFFPASSISSTYSTQIIGLPSSSFLVYKEWSAWILLSPCLSINGSNFLYHCLGPVSAHISSFSVAFQMLFSRNGISFWLFHVQLFV